ncbi:5640_t:CDS:1 [Cetraspora pellucida]|uniref:5640_t:CDS:1 n=1 Tax=Cetraspora pellucida TaxID=1433469 RepID=A0A9N9HQ97_9GLOM|nr:5640_t:CDS:1 [Cetraspora pellucida]
MVNASEWLNQKIPKNQRAQATSLYIYVQCQSGHNVNAYNYNCTYCTNPNQYQNNNSTPPTYQFYNVILESELNLNDFINLQQLFIQGNGQQQHKLTNLKIDKCNKLTTLTITYTTLNNLNIKENSALQNVNLTYNQLGHLSLCSEPKYQNLNLGYNQKIVFDSDDKSKDQVKRLIGAIRKVKSTGIVDLKLVAKKIEEEILEYQLAVTKDKLSKDNQSWLELLLETQEEVLQNDNTFARKLLEKVKKQLSDVLTAEEIQDFLGKKVELNELEIQINGLKIQEQETSK